MSTKRKSAASSRKSSGRFATVSRGKRPANEPLGGAARVTKTHSRSHTVGSRSLNKTRADFVAMPQARGATAKGDFVAAPKIRKAPAEPTPGKKLSYEVMPLDISEYLDNEETIAEYLTACLEDPNPAVFMAAVGDVAKARGITKVVAEAGLSRESLYKPSPQVLTRVMRLSRRCCRRLV